MSIFLDVKLSAMEIKPFGCKAQALTTKPRIIHVKCIRIDELKSMTTQLVVFSSCDIAAIFWKTIFTWLTDVNIVRYKVVQGLATLWFKAKALTTKPRTIYTKCAKFCKNSLNARMVQNILRQFILNNLWLKTMTTMLTI